MTAAELPEAAAHDDALDEAKFVGRTSDAGVSAGGASEGGLPPAAFVAALAGFDRMTVRRLHSLLAIGDPRLAFALAAGRERPVGPLASMLARDVGLAARWREQSRVRSPVRCWQQCLDAGVDVIVADDPRFPPQLLNDPAPPAALFVRGDPGVLDARRVGIVGTRNATQRGLETAARFGHELAQQGVVVVSGLARGIDGAAHRGALAADAAPVAAVVGNGPDVPYPREHAALWHEVACRGVLLSEWPPGTPPARFRFPMRNRILAALCEVLVVVESRDKGGGLITAREALDRNVQVMAVPGSLQTLAASGTNRLLRDGAAPATDTDEILAALGLDGRRAGRARFDPRPLPRGRDALIIDRCAARARSIDEIVNDFGLSLADGAMTLARLEQQGWLRETGGWFETVGHWDDLA
ncbi:MAG: DNA-processing protein DprA [Acidimicrobiia bacterium]|nr:DNA-processing protein DprA [Acidimicrobiia bacterium]